MLKPHITAPDHKRDFIVYLPDGRALHVYAKHENDNPADFPGGFIDLVGDDEDEMLACVEYDSCAKDMLITGYRTGIDEPSLYVHDGKKPMKNEQIPMTNAFTMSSEDYIRKEPDPRGIPDRFTVNTPIGELRFYEETYVNPFMLRSIAVVWTKGKNKHQKTLCRVYYDPVLESIQVVAYKDGITGPAIADVLHNADCEE